jgi:acyl-coenzyme A synthetase/AMP-(fatty) acid ligase
MTRHTRSGHRRPGCSPDDYRRRLRRTTCVEIRAKGGGEVVAFVVLAPGVEATEQEILAFGQQQLAAYQVPASVTFVDRLPRNSVGKLLRVQLRALVPPST